MKPNTIDRILLSAAALVAAVAVLVFALRGGTAYAGGGSGAGAIGRYQLSAGDHEYRVIDTTTGDIFTTNPDPDPSAPAWIPLSHQVGAFLAAPRAR